MQYRDDLEATKLRAESAEAALAVAVRELNELREKTGAPQIDDEDVTLPQALPSELRRDNPQDEFDIPITLDDPNDADRSNPNLARARTSAAYAAVATAYFVIALIVGVRLLSFSLLVHHRAGFWGAALASFAFAAVLSLRALYASPNVDGKRIAIECIALFIIALTPFAGQIWLLYGGIARLLGRLESWKSGGHYGASSEVCPPVRLLRGESRPLGLLYFALLALEVLALWCSAPR